jgi:hypothetical protein
MREPERWQSHVHSVGYYNALWKCVRNSIRRDPDLLRDPKIQAYVKNVIMNTMWYRDIGRFEDKEDINDSNSFLMTDRLEDATPTTGQAGGLYATASSWIAGGARSEAERLPPRRGKKDR